MNVDAQIDGAGYAPLAVPTGETVSGYREQVPEETFLDVVGDAYHADAYDADAVYVTAPGDLEDPLPADRGKDTDAEDRQRGLLEPVRSAIKGVGAWTAPDPEVVTYDEARDIAEDDAHTSHVKRIQSGLLIPAGGSLTGMLGGMATGDPLLRDTGFFLGFGSVGSYNTLELYKAGRAEGIAEAVRTAEADRLEDAIGDHEIVAYLD